MRTTFRSGISEGLAIYLARMSTHWAWLGRSLTIWWDSCLHSTRFAGSGRAACPQGYAFIVHSWYNFQNTKFSLLLIVTLQSNRSSYSTRQRENTCWRGRTSYAFCLVQESEEHFSCYNQITWSRTTYQRGNLVLLTLGRGMWLLVKQRVEQSVWFVSDLIQVQFTWHMWSCIRGSTPKTWLEYRTSTRRSDRYNLILTCSTTSMGPVRYTDSENIST